jgi:CrcB protein
MLETLARYWLSGIIARRFGETFPTGTLAINLIGCLLIGFLFYWLEERVLIDPAVRIAVLLGLLGGFTTFSSYGLQTFTLIQDGEILQAGIYVGASNVAGFILVWLGYSLSKAIGSPSW